MLPEKAKSELSFFIKNGGLMPKKIAVIVKEVGKKNGAISNLSFLGIGAW